MAEGVDPFEDETDERRCSGSALSRASFFTTGDSFPTFGLPPAAAAFGCFLVLLPARNSSKRSGRGRKCVRSYRPHLLQTILPGLSVDRRQLGGSVVWQLKHRLRRYWVSFEAASSVCCTKRPACGERHGRPCMPAEGGLQ